MHVKQELLDRNSLDEFRTDINHCLSSSCSIIHVRTSEVQRALMACRMIAAEHSTEYTEWDLMRGFTKYSVTDIDDHMKAATQGMPSFDGAMEKVLKEMNGVDPSKSPLFFVFTDPTPFWESPASMQLMRVAAASLSISDRCFIMVTPDRPPPADLADLVSTVRLNPPGFSELLEILNDTVESQSFVTFSEDEDEERASLCFAGAGMSEHAFRDALFQAIIVEKEESEDGETVSVAGLIPRVSRAKTQIVNSNDILELYPSEDMSHVGGMENLKLWIEQRRGCYSDEAAEMGVEPPKGVVLVGIPGTGKSLIAKAVSSVFGVPLIRLDFGRVFNSLVGSSEQRMREALRMVEFMAPLVLLVDEVDKGLGGISSGGGDSGTSQRVFGTFLTWLQECKAPVFCIVTANNIAQLPPELSRRGRFDNIFYTGLPDTNERKQVLSIHLDKRGWDDFDSKDMNLVVQATAGFVHAEIEAVVKDGLILAFSRKEDFCADHVIEVAKTTIPLSKAYFTEIMEMLLWCSQNATPASKRYEVLEETEDGKGKVTSLGSRRTIRGKKKDGDKEKE